MSAPLGYYVTADDAECARCHRPEEWDGFENWEAPPPIFYGTEADAPTHCSACGDLIPHELTDEGYQQLEHALTQGSGRPDVLVELFNVYRDGLDDRIDLDVEPFQQGLEDGRHDFRALRGEPDSNWVDRPIQRGAAYEAGWGLAVACGFQTLDEPPEVTTAVDARRRVVSTRLMLLRLTSDDAPSHDGPASSAADGEISAAAPTASELLSRLRRPETEPPAAGL